MKFIFDNYEKIKFLLFVLLIASLPFHHSFSSVLIIITTVFSLLTAYPFKGIFIRNIDRLSAAFVCYFLLEVIGLLYTSRENLGNGIFNLQKHLGLVVIPFIFYDFKINVKRREIFLLTFAASCFIGTIICVIVNVYLSLTLQNTFFDAWRFSHARLSSPIDIHPVYFAMYLGVSILIILDQIQEKHALFSNAKFFLLTLLVCYFFGMILLLGARTITVILVFMITAGILRYAVKHKSYKVLMILGIIPLIFAGILFLNPHIFNRFTDIAATSYDHSSYGGFFSRSKIWEPGIQVIKENFLFGVGTGDDQTELDKKFIEFNYSEGVQAFNMHNQYLQSFLSLGVIGFLLFVLTLIIQFKSAYLKRDSLYFSFLMIFMVGCVTESMLCTHKGIVFFLIISFIFYKSQKEGRGSIQ